jgi:hypothetical protein
MAPNGVAFSTLGYLRLLLPMYTRTPSSDTEIQYIVPTAKALVVRSTRFHFFRQAGGLLQTLLGQAFGVMNGRLEKKSKGSMPALYSWQVFPNTADYSGDGGETAGGGCFGRALMDTMTTLGRFGTEFSHKVARTAQCGPMASTDLRT